MIHTVELNVPQMLHKLLMNANTVLYFAKALVFFCKETWLLVENPGIKMKVLFQK
jgi:hypothetical protein